MCDVCVDVCDMWYVMCDMMYDDVESEDDFSMRRWTLGRLRNCPVMYFTLDNCAYACVCVCVYVCICVFVFVCIGVFVFENDAVYAAKNKNKTKHKHTHTENTFHTPS